MQDQFDPMTIWTRNAIVWVRFWQSHQEMWLRLMGRMAETIPHQDSRELAAEADAMCSEEAKKRRPTPPRTTSAKAANGAGKPQKDMATAAT